MNKSSNLKKVTIIGDSLSTNFHIDNHLNMLYQLLSWRHRGVFTGTRKIRSVCDILKEHSDVSCRQLARINASVDNKNKIRPSDKLFDIRHMSEQVDDLLEEELFPDLLLIWIGHNDLDYVESFDDHDFDLDEVMKDFEKRFIKQMDRIFEAHTDNMHKMSIVVFGLINMESFFKAREQMEILHKQDPKKYPFLETDYDYFVSLKPEFRENMITLSIMFNDLFRNFVAANTAKYKTRGINLIYSDVFTKINISDPTNFNKIDAWHPNVKGRKKLIEAASGFLVKKIFGV